MLRLTNRKDSLIVLVNESKVAYRNQLSELAYLFTLKLRLPPICNEVRPGFFVTFMGAHFIFSAPGRQAPWSSHCLPNHNSKL